MPAGPDVGARLAATVADVVVRAELAMLLRVRNAVLKDTAPSAWARGKTMELTRLREQLVRELAWMDADLTKSVRIAVERAYQLGANLAVDDLTASRVEASLPPARESALHQIVADTLAPLSSLAPVVLRTTVDAYQAAVLHPVGAVILGAQTRREAAQQMLNKLLSQGITGFTDKGGRNWRLESYVEMAVRTGTGQAALHGHLDTLAAHGQDLIYVIPGPRACPDCDRWRGKVLSISGETTSVQSHGHAVRVTPLEAARSGRHLYGPNCRCASGLYLPDITTPHTGRPDPKTYRDEVRQREIEREIRKWKRRQVLALDPGEAERARKKVREWQAAQRAHVASNPELIRKYPREQINRAI